MSRLNFDDFFILGKPAGLNVIKLSNKVFTIKNKQRDFLIL